MRTVQQIYSEYKIMPNLQLHQLRVVAVAGMICNNFTQKVNAREVILASLFHDMGNIIKFDLTVFPRFLEPEGLKYWQGVKDEYIKKYGTDHHKANRAIARELGLSESVRACIEAVAFAKMKHTLESGSWERKICEYADSRVGPYGVVSLEERHLDGRKRYLNRQSDSTEQGLNSSQDRFNELMEASREMEKQIFADAKITPEDITDEAIKGGIEKLRDYAIE